MSNHRNEVMIRGDGSSDDHHHLPQLIQDVQRMQRELQPMKQQLRKRLALAKIENCKSIETLRTLWQRDLTTKEQQDNEIVCKLLSCWNAAANRCLFGGDPWNEDDRRIRTRENNPILPEKFLLDPQVVLAFLLNDRGGWDVDIAPCLRAPNKKVMMAVCAKIQWMFEKASPELRDDEDLVLLAPRKEHYRVQNIPFVSERLRKDKNMLLHAMRLGCTFAQAWWESVDLGNIMDASEQTELARGIMRVLSSPNPPSGFESGSLDFFLAKFAPQLRDDADLMLPFVQLNWLALKACSDRLRSDTRFVETAVSQNMTAYQYAKGPVRQEYERNRSRSTVLDELKHGLPFDDVPEELKADRDIIMAAWKAGERTLLRMDFPEALAYDTDFIRGLIDSCPKAFDCKDRFAFYFRLPDHQKQDEDIAKALLQAGFPYRSDILKKVPGLLNSREVLMSAVNFPNTHHDHHEFDDEVFAAMVRDQSSLNLWDDEEFVALACKSLSIPRTFSCYASRRLVANRDFLERMFAVDHDWEILWRTTHEFQLQNVDFMTRVVRETSDRVDEGWLRELNEAVWGNKQFVLACLENRWKRLHEVINESGPNSHLLNDKEIMFLSVKNRPCNLKHVSPTLRQDRGFILSLVRKIDGVLPYAPANMKYETEILLAAVARSSKAIADCFDTLDLDGEDFKFLCEFASKVRSDIATHESFQELLRGMRQPVSELSPTNQCADRGRKRKFMEYAGISVLCKFATDIRSTILGTHDSSTGTSVDDMGRSSTCRLGMLNLDGETGIALKKSIGEYAGIFPMGPQLQVLSAALSNIEKVGF